MKKTLSILIFVITSWTNAAAQNLDSAAVETLMDQAWEEILSQDNAVPGAVITVVKDGDVLLNKGYGVSDIDTGAPVDPDMTRLRIGSTSKLFTALTALALIEDGKLEFDVDVNKYLTEVKVKDEYPEPVTIRSLLSHQSGFDAGVNGYMVYDNNDVVMDKVYHQRHLNRVRPPRREIGYDNMGLGLLGTVSGIVNGSDFPQAVEDKVLTPLGLAKTAMGVPDRQLAHLPPCHTWNEAGEVLKCTPKFMYNEMAGAGDISTTGSDMARFMIALLAESCLEGRCVVSSDMFAEFTDLDRNRIHPRAKGLGYIIMEKEFGGHFAIGHDGGQDGFSTQLTLFPQHGIGIFTSQLLFMGMPERWNLSAMLDFVNRGSKINPYAGHNELTQRFANELLPLPPEKQVSAEQEIDPSILDSIEGVYFGTRSIGYQFLDKIFRALGQVSVTQEGGNVFIDGTGPWQLTGPGVLSSEDAEHDYYITDNGKDVFLQHSAGMPPDMLVKVPATQSANLTLLPFLLPILLAFPALIYGYVCRGSQNKLRFGLLTGFAGFAVLLGFYCELEYFSVGYLEEGPTAALVLWRLLLNLAWLASLLSLVLLLRNHSGLLGFNGFSQISVSLLVLLLAMSMVVVIALLPFWGFVGNFTGGLG